MNLFLSKMTSVGWRPGIGDPTFMGWITVVIYFIACILCFREWRFEKSRKLINFRFYAVLGFLLFALGVNKQLDFQTFFTQVGRMTLRYMGWMDYRRALQGAFIASVALVAFLFTVWIGYRILKSASRHLVSLLGLVLLVCFVVIRAASFHHFDRLIGKRLGIFSMNHALEIGSLLIIILGVVWSRLRSGSTPATLTRGFEPQVRSPDAD